MWGFIVEEDHNKLSEFWETVVLSVIGETLDDGDNITGIRVIDKSNPHKKQINHRVEVWFRDWKDDGFKDLLQDRMEKLMETCDMHLRIFPLVRMIIVSGPNKHVS